MQDKVHGQASRMSLNAHVLGSRPVQSTATNRAYKVAHNEWQMKIFGMM